MFQLNPISAGILTDRMFYADGGDSASDPLLFSDTFTDTNGTLLTAHTPDVDVVGGGWVIYDGAINIQSNEAQPTSSTVNVAAAETNEPDVLAVITATIGLRQSVAVRLSDALNYWIGWVDDGKLYEIAAGVTTERADLGTPSSVPNTSSLECSGSSITFSCETGLSVTYNSATSNQTETKHGIRTDLAANTSDNFSVNTL